MIGLSLLIFISTSLALDDYFVIGAYGVDRISWIDNAHDSLGLNTIHFGWPKDLVQAQMLLNKAEKTPLKVILPFAPGTDENIERRLSWYCYLWYKLWESDSNYFFHDTGSRVADINASNRYAWKCNYHKDAPGLMQYGPFGKQAKLPVRYLYLDTIFYTARFRLRIDAEFSEKNAKVCSLTVLSIGKNSNIVKADSVLRVKDFPVESTYMYFDLNFSKDDRDNDTDQYQYRIWWYTNTTLWIDHVEVKDCFVDSLLENCYDSNLNEIISYYERLPALYRFYLTDEPYYGHFTANNYISKFLKNKNLCGIQALGAQGTEFYANYASLIKPSELMFDYYPLRGASEIKRGRTNEEHGFIFQAMLDSLCKHLSEARMVSLEHNIKLLFIPQAFGKYDTLTTMNPDEGGIEGVWRLPTPRELRCIVWLSLAYGAKGIMYYRYRTKLTYEAGHPEWMRGLWRYDNTPREPLYTEVKHINQNLEKIGPLLLSLESKSVFKGNEIPLKDKIKYIYPSYEIQVGTFDNEQEETFLMIVNRHCRPADSIQIRIGIENTNTISLHLYDCLTEERILPIIRDWSNCKILEFPLDFHPGQGRLFKLVSNT